MKDLRINEDMTLIAPDNDGDVEISNNSVWVSFDELERWVISIRKQIITSSKEQTKVCKYDKTYKIKQHDFMEDLKHKVITKSIDKLSVLTGEDFHGYRSEIYNVLSSVFEAAASPNKQMQIDTKPCAYCEYHKEYSQTDSCPICGRALND